MSTWCLVTLPNSTEERIEVDLRENARQCLEKVCSSLGTLETDYFGLQYISAKGRCAGQPVWLNLRNPIGPQLQGPPPHQLRLRVKFYVPPHFLQQESTREQVYLNIRQDLLEGRIHVPDPQHSAVIGALIAQAELGNADADADADADAFDTDLAPSQYPAFLPEIDPTILRMVRDKHLKLAGLDSRAAKYCVIRDVVALVSYGVEYYDVKESVSGQEFHMGVGPEGVSLFERGTWNCVKQIEYSAIAHATQNCKTLQLNLLDDSGATCCLQLRLVSEPAARGLYRCLTEMFSFYCCDTVRSAVSVQFSRDLKGTLASLFNENSTLGKKYVFDIQRTLREAYDHARRRLYKLENARSQSESPMCTCNSGDTVEGASQLCATCLESIEHHTDPEPDNTLCCVCMDHEVDCVFTPCNHMECCSICAQRLDRCPVCRADIECTQAVFPSQLPWTRDVAREMATSLR